MLLIPWFRHVEGVFFVVGAKWATAFFVFLGVVEARVTTCELWFG